MTDTWPAIIYQKSTTDLATVLDSIEVPVDTVLQIDFMVFSTNVFLFDTRPSIHVQVAANGVNVYTLDIGPGTFIGAGSLQLPLQGYVFPGGTFLTFETVWDGGGTGFYYLDWHVAGTVTPSPYWLGITATAPPHG